MPRTPSRPTSWTSALPEVPNPPAFEFTTEQLEGIERLSEQYRASQQATVRALTGRLRSPSTPEANLRALDAEYRAYYRNPPIQSTLADRSLRSPNLQQIPRGSAEGPFLGVDRSAQPDRLRGARFTASWVDQTQTIEQGAAAFAMQWLADYDPQPGDVPTPGKSSWDLAKAGLAKLDAEEAELAKKTAHLGVHDPEPRVGAAARWNGAGPGRFSPCSCELCTTGRDWNAWANRNGVPLDDTVVDPRIRQGVINAD